MATRGNFWFVWRIPAILAALTVFGLLAALLGTGAWHWASWLALAVPLITIGFCLTRPRAR